jgi:ABC-type antimicrobial peptide transport system permease subunit
MSPDLAQLLHDPLISQALRFAIDLVGMTLLVFGMYYRRYHDKELVTAAALFNIFNFAVLTILSSVNFSVAAGFGLFAILALFTLRSEPLGKTEMTYFFGSVAIAVITSIQGTTIPFVAVTVLLLLLGAYVVDHPKMLQSVAGTKVSLDKIPPNLLSDPDALCAELSERLGVEVMSYQVLQLDYITEMVRLNVYFRKRYRTARTVLRAGQPPHAQQKSQHARAA